MGLVAVGLAAVTVTAADAQGLWPLGGRNVRNTRHQRGETPSTSENAARLQVQWVVDTDGDISATPAVDESSVYVPDWAGKLYAFNRHTGALRWSRTVASLTGVEAGCQPGLSPGTDFARATPAIAGQLLILGDQGGRCSAGARVFAVNKRTGKLKWVTQVDTHFAAIVSQPATVDPRDPRVAYVGVASMEEALAGFVPGYQCCTFRGSVVALDTSTGRILWKTWTVPTSPATAATGCGAAWAPSTGRGACSTWRPATTTRCRPQSRPAQPRRRRRSQRRRVSRPTTTSTRCWRSICGAAAYGGRRLRCPTMPGTSPACPATPTPPPVRRATAPTSTSRRVRRSSRSSRAIDVVRSSAPGQKSGVYWTFDRDTGATIWSTQVGPGGTLGGLQWGSAVDGARVYTQINNNAFGPPWTLKGGPDAGSDVPSFTGFFSGLDAATGQILWQTRPVENGVPFLGGAMGPVSSANGVVFACSFGQATLNPDFSVTGHSGGAMYALDASRGTVLWRFESGDFCAGGAAVSRGTVFWGTGYAQLGVPNLDGGGRLYAFGLP